MMSEDNNKADIEKIVKVNTDEAEPITYREARHDFNSIAPWILAINLVLAAIMFFASGLIFNEPQAGYLGGLLSGAFVISGVISFIALKAMGNRVTRSEKIGKNR